MITVIMYFLSVLLFLFAITVLLSIMTICVFCKEYLYDLISSISYISNIDCAFYAYKIWSTRTRVEKGACPFLSILLNDLSKIIISGHNGWRYNTKILSRGFIARLCRRRSIWKCHTGRKGTDHRLHLISFIVIKFSTCSFN